MTNVCPLCGARLEWRAHPRVQQGDVTHSPMVAYDRAAIPGPHAEVCPSNPFNTDGPLDLRASFARLFAVTGGRVDDLVGGAA